MATDTFSGVDGEVSNSCQERAASSRIEAEIRLRMASNTLSFGPKKHLTFGGTSQSDTGTGAYNSLRPLGQRGKSSASWADHGEEFDDEGMNSSICWPNTGSDWSEREPEAELAEAEIVSASTSVPEKQLSFGPTLKTDFFNTAVGVDTAARAPAPS